jgi:tRNA wybutosine-synthesizing protein 2
MKFKERLKIALKSELTQEELEKLPSGFQTISKIILLRLWPELYEKRFIIGKKCLELYPNMKSVYYYGGKILGQFRIPEKIEFLSGIDNPIVIHKEHNVLYKFDITKIMYSKGNLKERKYMATLVKPGEIVIDMFAGIGYFSLPMALFSEAYLIYSIELNPVAFKYLKENIKLNHLEDKIVPIFGNCNEEIKNLAEEGIRADRIVMAVFPAPIEYISSALLCVKESGTVVHYEGIKEKELYLSLFNDFNEVAKKNGYKCELKEFRIVKSYGPHLYHIVLDIFVYR